MRSYGSVCVGTGGLCSPGCGRAVCVAEVHGGGLRCWGLCVFVIKSLCSLWVFSVVVRLDRLDSGTTHTLFIFSHSLHCRKLYAATQHLMLLMMGMYLKYVELRIC